MGRVRQGRSRPNGKEGAHDDQKKGELGAIDEHFETGGGAVAARSTLPVRRVRLLNRPCDESDTSSSNQLNDQQLDGLDRQTLCEQILSEGFIQAFVDFFYLTHRPGLNIDNLPPGQAPSEIDIPPREMLFLKENLVAGEAARRRGDVALVYRCYGALARHFEAAGDPKTSVYYYERCLETGRVNKDPLGEMRANYSLGCIHRSMGDMPTGIEYHERQLELARAAGLAEEEKAAHAELVEVYAQSAEERERAGDHASALPGWHKSLESARAAGDRRGEGRAAHRLGAALIATGEPLRAINHLEDFEGIARATDDLEAQGQAFAALATAYQALANDEQSLLFLRRYLEVATSTQDLRAQGQACIALGALHTRRGEHAKAKDILARNFSIAMHVAKSGGGGGGGSAAAPAKSTAAAAGTTAATSTGTAAASITAAATSAAASAASVTATLDVSRTLLGIAVGNEMLVDYIRAVTGDLKGLLDWKSNRVRPGGGAGGSNGASSSSARGSGGAAR